MYCADEELPLLTVAASDAVGVEHTTLTARGSAIDTGNAMVMPRLRTENETLALARLYGHFRTGGGAGA
jgi:hypothetical protein